MNRLKRNLMRVLFYCAVIFVCGAVLLPFVLLISYSARTTADIFALDVRLIPEHPTFAAYRDALFNYQIGGTGFLQWATNSLLIGGGATFVSIMLAAFCGYGISRYRFYGKPILWFLIVLTQSIPWVVLLLPYYVLLNRFGMLDNRMSLSITYVAVFVPVSTWLFTGFFNSIGTELEDAARIDGCGNWGVFFRIIFPLSMSGVSAIALFAFVIGWGDFLFASILTRSAHRWTLPIGLMSFRGEYVVRWAEIMAMATMITIPVVGLFLYLQKNLIDLLTGGVKQ